MSYLTCCDRSGESAFGSRSHSLSGSGSGDVSKLGSVGGSQVIVPCHTATPFSSNGPSDSIRPSKVPALVSVSVKVTSL